MAIVRKQAVTLAVLQLKPGQVFYIRIEDQIHTGEKVDDRKEAAEICSVTDMESGELRTLVTSTVMRNELMKKYPQHTYVGKFFEVSQSRREGKRYNDVSLVEIEDPTGHFEQERAKKAAAVAEAERAAKAAEKAVEDAKKGKVAKP